MKSMQWVAALSFVGIALGTVTASKPAAACGDGLWEPPSAEEKAVGDAESLLDAGEEAKAAELISGRFWYVRGSLPHAGTAHVFQRAMRVLALAASRKDGAVRVGAPYSYGSEIARKENVQWAISRLRMLDKASPDSYSFSSDLAEALSRNAATRAEGKEKLEALFASNELVGRHALNQLTRLRAEGGDIEGAKAAADKCERDFGAAQCEAPTTATVASK